MDVLQSFLQLTLYGLKINAAERNAILTKPPSTWEDLLKKIETETTVQKLEDFNWCQTIWQNLERWTKAYDLKWTFPGAEDYPAKLLAISEPPLILCYRGEAVWRDREILSVVGSREPMGDSKEWMRRFLLPFIREIDMCIASGGARGIDAFAHELTMLGGKPPVCFLPSGILRPYPDQHDRLFHRMLEAGGVLVSGFAPEARMQKSYFHARNRWIAGISVATLVVEAQRKSGSYLTARMAMDEGKPIATLPVSPLSVRGLANLDLIYSGAQMLRDKEDLMMFVGSSLFSSQRIQAKAKEDDVDSP